MDRDTHYGGQYLFIGYPQLYVSQIKRGIYWLSQVERLWASGLYWRRGLSWCAGSWLPPCCGGEGVSPARWARSLS
jgi:hypothetical protein